MSARTIHSGRRKPLAVDASALVSFKVGECSERIPLFAKANIAGVDLADWMATQRSLVTNKLHDYGALLFRGFGSGSGAELSRIARMSHGELLAYSYRSTPRSDVADAEGVYTSTEYPADQWIPLHNEMAYARTWPLRLWFCCIEPAAGGGMTPIADSRRVLARIAPEVRAEFEAKGVRYVRNYGTGLDLPWQEVFQTNARSEVEALCARMDMTCEWGHGDDLRTAQSCPAVTRHLGTGQEVWFNQAHLFHAAALAEPTRSMLVSRFGIEGLPRHATFGDGSPIDDLTIRHIDDAYVHERRTFEWQAGDVLLLDNILAAHGRSPFSGKRRVIVAMTGTGSVSGRG